MSRYQRIISPLLTLLFCVLLTQTTFFSWLTDVGLDILFKLRGEKETSQSIVIVGIDEQTLQELGSWPFSRESHAKLLQQLRLAKSIGFDLIFAYDGTGDHTFAEVVKDGPPISVAVARDYNQELLLPSEPINNQVTLGHIETELGVDGVVRRVFPYKFDFPVLSLAMIENHEPTALKHVGRDSQLLINFYGPEFTFLYLSYIDVLSGKYGADFFAGRYVLVGANALALGDVHISPYSRRIPVPGVEIQATILNNLLEESYLKEDKLFIIGFGLLFILVGIWIWPQQSEARNLSLNLMLSVVFFFGSLGLFHLNLYLNPLIPLFVLLVSYLLHAVVQWASLTARLVKELRVVNAQLEQGVQTVLKGLPESFDKEAYLPGSISLVGAGGLKNHILRIHKGVKALALQNSFIKHLLSEEAPPLVIWQKESGGIILANFRFINLWKSIKAGENNLPDLFEFCDLVKEKSVDIEDNELLDSFFSSRKTEERVWDICVRKKGKKIYLRVVVNEVNSNILGLEGVLAGFTDVTEIRELERLKGEMMNIVSHELKLPLTTILGFSEMLSDSLGGVEQGYANEISRQSQRLAKMIEDFLHIARIESGKYTINRYPLDLISVVYDASSVVFPVAEKKNIEVDYNLPEKISPILGDESLITQAVLNLLDNAVKFSHENTTVKVRLTELQADLELLIEDEGPGISDADKAHVFEKFVRGQSEQKATGFGLGLSFVNQVVESHGGYIQVGDSTSGGAAFSVLLPKTNKTVS